MSSLEEIKSKYPDPRSALLPALYLAQKELGWLSPEALSQVAKTLNLPEAAVRGTATFYSMFRQVEVGRHLIQLCTNVSCMILGAERLVEWLETRYGLVPNGTTSDGRFSLVVMECIGACGTGPAMLVDTDFHEDLNEDNLEGILERYK